MTEWEKREEIHCQALEEAEKILEAAVVLSRNAQLNHPSTVFVLYTDIVGKAEEWLKKWCKEE